MVVVDCRNCTATNAELRCEVCILVSGAVARVQDFVVVWIIDMQFMWANPDDGACLVRGIVALRCSAYHISHAFWQSQMYIVPIEMHHGMFHTRASRLRSWALEI